MSIFTDQAAAAPAEASDDVQPESAPRGQLDVRVNLLPKVVAERIKERRARRLAVVLVAASMAGVGGLWFISSQEVTAATSEVATATAALTAANAEAARYNDVPRIFAAVEKAQTDLQTAMGKDVRWSYVLNDLSLVTPPGVALQSMTVIGASGDSTAAPGTVGADAAPVAKVTWTGEATGFYGIAAWLDALSKLPTYSNPYFSQSTKDSGSGHVTFTSTADVGPAALSHRFDRKAAQ